LFAAVAVVKPIAATIDIAFYLHNSTSHHEHSYSKYVLADCSLVFSFVSSYDRSCVYSNSTVGVAAHCFIGVAMQAMDFAVPGLSLDSLNPFTGFLTNQLNVFGKIIIF
jgi:hypothetical protein